MGFHSLASLSSPRRVPSACGTQASFLAPPGSFLDLWGMGRGAGVSWSWAGCQGGFWFPVGLGPSGWWKVGKGVILDTLKRLCDGVSDRGF